MACFALGTFHLSWASTLLLTLAGVPRRESWGSQDLAGHTVLLWATIIVVAVILLLIMVIIKHTMGFLGCPVQS